MSNRIDSFHDLRWAIRGMAISQALGAACNLGLADHLPVDAPASVDALAQACGTDAQTVGRLVRLLAALGIFSINRNGQVSHTPTSAMLRQDNTPSVFNAIRFWTMPAIWDAWGELSAGIARPAIPFAAANGRGFFAHLSESDTDRAIFQGLMMKGGFVGRHEAVADALTLAPHDVVVDLGGGEGHLLLAVLARNPQAQGILFDLPEVLGDTLALAAPDDVRKRCRLVAGDFFQSAPSGGTVYLLSWVLHDWSDEKAGEILRTVRAVMQPGARLVIVDRLLNEDPAQCDAYDLLEDINMFVLFHGRERTQADFNVLLDGAGFAPLTVGAMQPGFAVLETQPR